MKKCWYTVALVYSLGAAVLIDATPGLMKDVLAMQGEQTSGNDVVQETVMEQINRAPGNPIGEHRTLPEIAAATSSIATASTATLSEPADTSADGPQALMPVIPADFSGALFIGDSRTVGLSEYGDLGEAEVFANTGMSVFNLFASEASLKDGSKTTLEQVLAGNRYQTIYLMLGINELGYKNYEIVERYKTVVDKIKEMQPDAILVLEANLHVTEEKSAQSPIYNNQNINALNQEIEQIAKSRGCFYIDVNEIFDDDSGNLDAGFSSDGSHVYGKYYSVWGDWLRGIAETDG